LESGVELFMCSDGDANPDPRQPDAGPGLYGFVHESRELNPKSIRS
jgi:hypothetical protein